MAATLMKVLKAVHSYCIESSNCGIFFFYSVLIDADMKTTQGWKGEEDTVLVGGLGANQMF